MMLVDGEVEETRIVTLNTAHDTCCDGLQEGETLWREVEKLSKDHSENEGSKSLGVTFGKEGTRPGRKT